MEHVGIAARAAQRVGIAAGIDEHGLHSVSDLTDREAGRRRNLADNDRDLVALDQALGLGGGGLRIDRVLHDELDLAAHHATDCVDLISGELDAHHRVFAERSQEARQRREVSDSDRIGLRLDQSRHADAGEHRGTGSDFDKCTT